LGQWHGYTSRRILKCLWQWYFSHCQIWLNSLKDDGPLLECGHTWANGMGTLVEGYSNVFGIRIFLIARFG
jgi:hypothetical protein